MPPAMNIHRTDKSVSQKPGMGKIALRGFVLLTMSMAGLAGALFAFDGRTDWTWAWVLIITFLVAVTCNMIVLYRVNPEVIFLRLCGAKVRKITAQSYRLDMKSSLRYSEPCQGHYK